MPKLCEQLTWLDKLRDRVKVTDMDERHIRAIRGLLIAADGAKDSMEWMLKKLRGEVE